MEENKIYHYRYLLKMRDNQGDVNVCFHDICDVKNAHEVYVENVLKVPKVLGCCRVYVNEIDLDKAFGDAEVLKQEAEENVEKE
ncbi:MAG: hypothetical protein [Chaetfec virus UA24_2268]|nr:MAG: hypothetical protein [Chaetfec virus UA24_2268]